MPLIPKVKRTGKAVSVKNSRPARFSLRTTTVKIPAVRDNPNKNGTLICGGSDASMTSPRVKSKEPAAKRLFLFTAI